MPMFAFGEMVDDSVSRLPGLILGSGFLVAGTVCLVMLVRIRRRDRKFRQYAALIGNQKRIPLQWIAQKMGRSQEIAIKDLRQAVAAGMFTDAHIDEKNGYLLFPNRNIGASETVICHGCGAGVEVMAGYYANCCYCGAVLNTGSPEPKQ